MNGSKDSQRVPVLAVVLAMAVGATTASCGGTSQEAGDASKTPRTPATSDSQRDEIKAMVRYTWKLFAAAADDPRAAKKYCMKLTPAYQDDQVEASFGSANTCHQAVTNASHAWHRRGYTNLPVRFYSISIKDREAFVKTSGGAIGHQTYRLRLVKDGSGWKLPSGALEPL